MLERRFLRGLAHRRAAHGDGLDLIVYGCEGQTGELLAVGCRTQQADANEHNGANHEHEDGVVQEIHVNAPARNPRFETMSAGTLSNFQDETRGAQTKPESKEVMAPAPFR